MFNCGDWDNADWVDANWDDNLEHYYEYSDNYPSFGTEYKQAKFRLEHSHYDTPMTSDDILDTMLFIQNIKEAKQC